MDKGNHGYKKWGGTPKPILHHHYESERWIAIHQPAQQHHVGEKNQPRTLGDVFSNGSADNAAVEQSEETERQIAEAIFDWWISGKSYSEWYSQTFKELKINFNE